MLDAPALDSDGLWRTRPETTSGHRRGCERMPLADSTMKSGTMGSGWTRSLPGRREVLWIGALWTGAALLAGTAAYLSTRMESPVPGWLRSVAGPAIAGAIWIVLTVAVVWAARRFPPLRVDQGVRVAPAAALGHGTAALLVTFALNAAFLLIAEPQLIGSFGGYGSEVARLGLANLHFNFGVYWIIVLVALAPGVVAGRPASDRPSPSQETLTVRSGRSRVRVRVSEVLWIEGAGDYACLHLDDSDHLLSERLKNLEARLDPQRFVRVHRSAIVNVDAVEKLRHLGHGDHEATLIDGSTVRISRTRRTELEAVLEMREVGGG